MKDAFEIRFHARSGQGAKTAAQFVAEAAALDLGKEVQAFAEYSAERTGAPMKTYVRIADREIRTHEPIVHPNVVVVLDQSLADSEDVTQGLRGIMIINSGKDAAYFRKRTGYRRVYTINATAISMSFLKANYPNMPLLGALVRLTGIISMKALEHRIKEKYLKKLGEEKTNANIQAARKGYEVVS